jgi:hypothetical protein
VGQIECKLTDQNVDELLGLWRIEQGAEKVRDDGDVAIAVGINKIGDVNIPFRVDRHVHWTAKAIVECLQQRGRAFGENEEVSVTPVRDIKVPCSVDRDA